MTPSDPSAYASARRDVESVKDPVTVDEVRLARARVGKYLQPTPVLRSRHLDARADADVFLKAECLQPTGAFKVRGAFNRLDRLKEAERARGVVAWSAGNHGQALAYAGAMLGVRVTVCMPMDASPFKIARTRELGGEVVLVDPAVTSREAEGRRLAREHGWIVVPPYDDPDVIAGQGTLALELAQQQTPPLDALIVCCGGGGLVAGCALTLASISPATKVIAVEAQGWDNVGRAWRGEPPIGATGGPPTFADALATVVPGELTGVLNTRYLSGAVTVSDGEILQAVRYAARELKVILEPGGAAALAAVLGGRVHLPGQAVGVVLSGGNVSLGGFADLLASERAAPGEGL